MTETGRGARPPFDVVIPARYGASRLPGKPLIEVAGAPVIAHVHERARESGAERIIIATDDARIAEAGADRGAEVMLTRAEHASGTDRAAEVVERLGLPPERIVVNLQGDEPLMPPSLLAAAARALAADAEAAIGTLAVPVCTVSELFDTAAVKVVRDRQGRALYFSRATVPWDRARFPEPPDEVVAGGTWLRHLGIYAYRAEFLDRFPTLEPAPPEQLEALEQLRALWHGFAIQVDLAPERPGPGVDTPEDLEAVAAALSARQQQSGGEARGGA